MCSYGMTIRSRDGRPLFAVDESAALMCLTFSLLILWHTSVFVSRKIRPFRIGLKKLRDPNRGTSVRRYPSLGFSLRLAPAAMAPEIVARNAQPPFIRLSVHTYKRSIPLAVDRSGCRKFMRRVARDSFAKLGAWGYDVEIRCEKNLLRCSRKSQKRGGTKWPGTERMAGSTERGQRRPRKEASTNKGQITSPCPHLLIDPVQLSTKGGNTEGLTVEPTQQGSVENGRRGEAIQYVDALSDGVEDATRGEGNKSRGSGKIEQHKRHLESGQITHFPSLPSWIEARITVEQTFLDATLSLLLEVSNRFLLPYQCKFRDNFHEQQRHSITTLITGCEVPHCSWEIGYRILSYARAQKATSSPLGESVVMFCSSITESHPLLMQSDNL